MIELERHIEILLLDNDCVIVPDLGGFMTHHLEAHFDDTDNMFLPPQRTLGFNPQLKLNDSLLAQSYIEAYDISYPEAIRRIEAEVNELKQHLDNEGSYELNDIGLLSVNDEGKLEFEPCEAGILTPELYGLSSFEMAPLSENVRRAKPVVEQPAQVVDEDTEDEAETPATDGAEQEAEPAEERAITIKMSWIRNSVAAAAAIMAFFLMTTPVSNTGESHISKSQINLPLITRDSNTKVADKTIDRKTVQQALGKAEEESQNTPSSPDTQNTPNTESTESAPSSPSSPAETGYCIIVASQVSQRNAEEYAAKLQSQGLDARVFIHNNIRRVACGIYRTEAEAYKQLNEIHRIPALADAWVYRMK